MDEVDAPRFDPDVVAAIGAAIVTSPDDDPALVRAAVDVGVGAGLVSVAFGAHPDLTPNDYFPYYDSWNGDLAFDPTHPTVRGGISAGPRLARGVEGSFSGLVVAPLFGVEVVHTRDDLQLLQATTDEAFVAFASEWNVAWTAELRAEAWGRRFGVRLRAAAEWHRERVGFSTVTDRSLAIGADLLWIARRGRAWDR